MTHSPAPDPFGDVPLLAGVAAHGLAGTLADMPDAPLDDNSWRRLLSGARLQRVTGLLVAAIEDGTLPATSRQVRQATELHLRAMTLALRLEAALVDLAGLLDVAQVPFRVLKGLAASHLDYPNPGLRSFHDVDLLVPPDHFDLAVQALERAGLRRRFPSPRPGFDALFAKAVTLVDPAGVEVDLHRTFALGPFGQRIATGDLWSGPGQPFVLGGVTLSALEPELRLLHAAYHAVLGDHPPRLVPLRDIAQLALRPAVTTSRVLALVAAWGGEPVLARAVGLAWRTLRLADLIVLSTWAEGRRTTAREERELSWYVGDNASFAGKSYAAVRAIPRTADRLAYLRALLLPQRSYLDGRHAGRLARLRHGTAAVLGRGEPR